MEARIRTSRAKKTFDTICQNNRVYVVPKAISLQISRELQDVSLEAHKEYLCLQNEAQLNLRDKRYI